MSNVNHPKHYNQGKIEVIEFIEDKNLNFHLGNTVKYICRAGLKDPSKTIEDLEKARWYLERQIETLKAQLENRKVIKPNDMHPVELDLDGMKPANPALIADSIIKKATRRSQ